MKKVITIIMITLAMLCMAAQAESVDLSGLSFQELAALRDRAQMEMMQRDAWQEVTVPQGVYQVGVQIPAGTWTVRCATGNYTEIDWGDTLKDNGQGVEYGNRYDWAVVYNPSGSYYSAGDQTEYTFSVRDGEYIIIKDGMATFMPGGVTPSFTFK